MDDPYIAARTRAGRGSAAFLKAQAQCFTEETNCWWCGAYVDQTLPPTHPMGRTADHVVELWRGGEPTDRSNLRLCHRRCNTIKGNQARGGRRSRFTVDVASL